MLVQNPPPSLDSDASSQKIFSRELHDLVAACLKKDKNERPTTGDLLEHRFFKHLPRDRDHLRRRMLAGLPDVITRVQQMRAGGAPSGTNFEVELEMQAKSDEEYRKGVSSWNFDVQALKVQVCTCSAPKEL
jgi:serine/threonine-protein kinase OSR1/STK39